MSLPLIILLSLTLVFAIQGYFKGLLQAISWFVSLIFAYIASFVGFRPLADWLQQHTGLEGMILWPLAGLIIFITVSLLVSAVFNYLHRRLHTSPRATRVSRIGGLIAGAATGALLALLGIYLLTLVQDWKKNELVADSPRLTDWSRQLVSSSGRWVAGFIQPEAASIVGAFLYSPVETGQRVQALVQSDELKQLLNDPEAQRLLSLGDEAALQQHPAFQELIAHPEVPGLLQQTGLVEDGVPVDKAVAGLLAEAGQAVETFRQHPEVIRITRDPDFQQKLASRDVSALMQDPRFMDLANTLVSTIKENRKQQTSGD